jgi:hypothetical protein
VARRHPGRYIATLDFSRRGSLPASAEVRRARSRSRTLPSIAETTLMRPSGSKKLNGYSESCRSALLIGDRLVQTFVSGS